MNLLEQCGLKMEYLWIALGSAVGGVARYWLPGVDEKIQHLLPHLERWCWRDWLPLEDDPVLKYRANQEKPRT